MTQPFVPAGKARDVRLDVVRGLALLTIFINHVPDNPLERFTSRNFGFSDAAEAFVLMSGLAVALAYAGGFFRNDWRGAAGRMLRRAGKLYLVHVVTMSLALMVLAAGVTFLGTGNVAEQVNFTRLQTDGWKAVLGIPLLGYQIGYFNILPLYVVLLVAAVALLAVGMRNVWVMLALSACIWTFAHLTGLNLPNWPGDWGWFLNPFGWQLVFACGIAIGLGVMKGRPLVPYNPVLHVLSWGFVLFSAFWVKLEMGAVPGLPHLPPLFADTDKGALAFLRLVHVLALAYAVIYTGWIGTLLSSAPLRPVATIGRNGLAVFAAGSLLAILLQVAFEAWPVSEWGKVLFVAAGIAVHYAVALYFDGRKREKTVRSPRLVNPAPLRPESGTGKA
ncbi:OpgC family protein [Zhengella sp. ZM62]|uniref:OpgC family protein n=1 Tax=Zhengella sedimenti TaxID=3390035 RepID=UPI0039760715